MTRRRSKDIGTAAEKAVRDYLAARYPDAMIIAQRLAGSADVGDVLVYHPDKVALVIEVKAGKAAENASVNEMRVYLSQAKVEAANYESSSACPQGTLVQHVAVRKTAGYGAGRVDQWEAITGETDIVPIMIRTTFGEYLDWSDNR